MLRNTTSKFLPKERSNQPRSQGFFSLDVYEVEKQQYYYQVDNDRSNKCYNTIIKSISIQIFRKCVYISNIGMKLT